MTSDYLIHANVTGESLMIQMGHSRHPMERRFQVLADLLTTLRAASGASWREENLGKEGHGSLRVHDRTVFL